jgi:retinol dehydrogenase 12
VTVVVLTGATRGIGRAAAIELARRGAEVVLVGRDPERVRLVAEEATTAGGGGRVHGHVSDLSLMSNVRVLADEIRGHHEHVDVLANNAGALFASRKETSDLRAWSRPSRSTISHRSCSRTCCETALPEAAS